MAHLRHRMERRLAPPSAPDEPAWRLIANEKLRPAGVGGGFWPGLVGGLGRCARARSCCGPHRLIFPPVDQRGQSPKAPRYIHDKMKNPGRVVVRGRG